MSYARLALSSSNASRPASRGAANRGGSTFADLTPSRIRGGLGTTASSSSTAAALPVNPDASIGSGGSSSGGGRATDWQADSRLSFHWEDFVSHRRETRAKLEALVEARQQQRDSDALTQQRLQQLDQKIEELRGFADREVDDGANWRIVEISSREGLERLGLQMQKCTEELHIGLTQLEEDLCQQGATSERRHKEIMALLQRANKAVADELLSKMAELNNKLGDNMQELEDELTNAVQNVSGRISATHEEMVKLMARFCDADADSGGDLGISLEAAQAQHNDLAKSVAESFLALRAEVNECKDEAAELHEQQAQRLIAAEQELQELRMDLARAQEKAADQRLLASVAEEARAGLVDDLESAHTASASAAESALSLRQALEEADLRMRQAAESTGLLTSELSLAEAQLPKLEAHSLGLMAEVGEAQGERRRLCKSLRALSAEVADAEEYADMLADRRDELGACLQETQSVAEDRMLALEDMLEYGERSQSMRCEQLMKEVEEAVSAEAAQASVVLKEVQEALLAESKAALLSRAGAGPATPNSPAPRAREPEDTAAPGSAARSVTSHTGLGWSPSSEKREVLSQCAPRLPPSPSAAERKERSDRREHSDIVVQVNTQLQQKMDGFSTEVMSVVNNLHDEALQKCTELQECVDGLSLHLRTFREEALQRFQAIEEEHQQMISRNDSREDRSSSPPPHRNQRARRKAPRDTATAADDDSGSFLGGRETEDLSRRLDLIRADVAGLHKSVGELTNDVLKAQGGADFAYAEVVKLQSQQLDSGGVREEILSELAKLQDELGQQLRGLGEDFQVAIDEVRQQCREWVDGSLHKLEDLSIRSKDHVAAVAAEVRMLKEDAIERGLEPLRGELAAFAASTSELEKLKMEVSGASKATSVKSATAAPGQQRSPIAAFLERKAGRQRQQQQQQQQQQQHEGQISPEARPGRETIVPRWGRGVEGSPPSVAAVASPDRVEESRFLAACRSAASQEDASADGIWVADNSGGKPPAKPVPWALGAAEPQAPSWTGLVQMQRMRVADIGGNEDEPPVSPGMESMSLSPVSSAHTDRFAP